MALTLFEAISTFREHAEEKDGELRTILFYKIREWDPKLYRELVNRFNTWIDECAQLVFDATKAANWFADTVRRDINPMFFAKEGKFIIRYGPIVPDLSFYSQLIEFTTEEKKVLPQSLIDKLYKKYEDKNVYFEGIIDSE